MEWLARIVRPRCQVRSLRTCARRRRPDSLLIRIGGDALARCRKHPVTLSVHREATLARQLAASRCGSSTSTAVDHSACPERTTLPFALRAARFRTLQRLIPRQSDMICYLETSDRSRIDVLSKEPQCLTAGSARNTPRPSHPMLANTNKGFNGSITALQRTGLRLSLNSRLEGVATRSL
jgi:hypothetical protein